MTNNEFKLLAENWRYCVKEGADELLEEGVKERIAMFIAQQIVTPFNKFKKYVEENAGQAGNESAESFKTIPEFAKILEDAQKFSEISKTVETSSPAIKETIMSSLITKKDAVLLYEEIKRQEKIFEKKYKQKINEFDPILGTISAIGIGLGVLGTFILGWKAVIGIMDSRIGKKIGIGSDKWPRVFEAFQNGLVKLESMEQTIKNLISRTKIFDELGYKILIKDLNIARKEGKAGKTYQFYEKKGIKDYLDPMVELPRFELLNNPEMYAKKSDIEKHIKGHGHDEQGAVHEATTAPPTGAPQTNQSVDVRKLSQADRRFLKGSGKSREARNRIMARRVEEAKILTSLIQAIVWRRILAFFAIAGVLGAALHAFHGLLAGIELFTASVKKGEIFLSLKA